MARRRSHYHGRNWSTAPRIRRLQVHAGQDQITNKLHSTQSSRSLSPKDSSKQILNPPMKPRDESTTLRQKASNLLLTPKKCSQTFSSASAVYDASSSNS